MGSPEWEDAEFEGDVGDPFFPDWWAVDLNGFVRPRWFVQGSPAACQAYLRAVRRGDWVKARLLWQRLELERWLRCRSTRSARLARQLARALKRGRYGLKRRTFHLRNARSASRSGEIGNVATQISALFRRARPEEVELLFRADVDDASRLTARYRELFPDRPPLTPTDYAEYARAAPGWRSLMAEYDIVQAYATDPIIPVLCGIGRFAAYEHGTLRKTPFEDSWLGRICALGYREASIVFITNSDVVSAARRLGLDEERLVYLPHAVDSERLLRYARSRAVTPSSVGPVTFLAPTRQDWRDADPSWTKGNDRAIRALSVLKQRRLECRLVLGEWGRDLAASIDLVEALGVQDYVTWTPALRKTQLWDAYLAAHAVLDQFVTPAIGGVTFEAMALGRRVITALDVEAAARFFGEAPPLHAASDPVDIADAMEAVIRDPSDTAGLGGRAQEWFASRHSADRIVDLQARAYAAMLGDEV
jgi:glycosyltransferase involved in cell wall biosynthesis